MKICQYSVSSSNGLESRMGILTPDNSIIDPNLCFIAMYEKDGWHNCDMRANHKIPTKLSELLEAHDNPILKLQESLDLYDRLLKQGIPSTKSGGLLKKKLTPEVQLLKPIDKISTYRDFYIHEKHVKKGFEKRGEKIPDAWFEIPAYYKGPSKSFIGTGEEILWPSFTDKLDYELELAMIIGKEGKNIKEKNALTHVFGFTILNDISARDVQKLEMSIRLGPSKSKDFCSVIGPVITTMDEFKGMEPDLLMTAKINGEEWSRGQSGDGHYSWAEIISYTSRDEWLLSCDLFGSGTVGTGCGLELDKWIKPNDVLTLEIEKIGILKNKIGEKKSKDI